MPRYYFNIHDSIDLPDEEGLDLSTDDEAWAEAVKSCGQAIKDMDGQLPRNEEWRMTVTDEAGTRVFTFRFIGNDPGA